MGPDTRNTYKHKGFAFTIYKERLQINKKKSDKWAKGLNSYFTKEDILMANKREKVLHLISNNEK